MRTYKVENSAAKAKVKEDKKQTSEHIGLGPYTGGPIESQGQLLRGLEVKPQIERILKEFVSAAKVWVDENGSVQGDGRKSWGASDYQREMKCNFSLEELSNLMLDAGVPSDALKRVTDALARRGVGEFKTLTRYGWGK